MKKSNANLVLLILYCRFLEGTGKISTSMITDKLNGKRKQQRRSVLQCSSLETLRNLERKKYCKGYKTKGKLYWLITSAGIDAYVNLKK